MAIDEGSRHALHTKLEQVLGPEEALTLMELTPPLGWGDMATKRDIDAFRGDFNDFRVETKEERERVWTELTHMRDQIDSHFRTTIFSMLTFMAGLVSLVFVVARFA